MKTLELIIASLLINLMVMQSSFAQVGDSFPEMEVYDLNEKKMVLPEDSKGKFTLVGVAFSDKAQEDLYSWSQPVYSEFMDENNLSSLVYDPNVYLVLMFTGVNQVAYKNAKKQINEGTDRSLKDNVMLYKGKMQDYRKDLKMKDRKTPYFFVLDKNGKIIYQTKGRYSRTKLEEVGDLIEE